MNVGTVEGFIDGSVVEGLAVGERVNLTVGVVVGDLVGEAECGKLGVKEGETLSTEDEGRIVGE